MKKGINLLPLTEKEQRCICDFIRMLIPIARDNTNPMCKIAKRNIALTLWNWTADAVDAVTGQIHANGNKYNVKVLRHTKAALMIRRGEKGLRHEHVIPRSVLADEIVTCNMSAEAIFTFLSKWCDAVIVTKKEDAGLKPKDAMPAGWTFKTGKRDQRYIDAKMEKKLLPPTSNPKAKRPFLVSARSVPMP